MEEEQAGSFRPGPRGPVPEELLGRLEDLGEELSKLLRPVDEVARRMDASLQDAHRLVEEIRGVVRAEVFGPEGPLDPVAYREADDLFESARTEENDLYEVYAYVLERQRKRQSRDLPVAESDEDKHAQVKRRRTYIRTLQAFQQRFSGILDYLRTPPPES